MHVFSFCWVCVHACLLYLYVCVSVPGNLMQQCKKTSRYIQQRLFWFWACMCLSVTERAQGSRHVTLYQNLSRYSLWELFCAHACRCLPINITVKSVFFYACTVENKHKDYRMEWLSKLFSLYISDPLIINISEMYIFMYIKYASCFYMVFWHEWHPIMQCYHKPHFLLHACIYDIVESS